MWISVSLLLAVIVGLSESFHLQHQPRIRMAVCRRAPSCCPGDVCRAYQRRDASRPVAACARTLDSRPLYAPGSRAQQRICGRGSISGQSVSRGSQQFGRRVMSPNFGQPRNGRDGRIRNLGLEGSTLGGASSRSWDQSTQTIPQRFPGQTMRLPGQDFAGQGRLSDFPSMPQMPSFGDQLAQPDFSVSGRRRSEQALGGLPNTFATLPGQDPFSQGQRSFGGVNDPLFGSPSGSSRTSQGQQFPPGQGFSSGQGFSTGQGFSAGQGFSSGQSIPSDQGPQFSSGQAFSAGQGFSSGQRFSTGQGFPSGQSVPSGQGFPQGQGFSSGQEFSTGQGLSLGPGFSPGQELSSGRAQVGQPTFGQPSIDLRRSQPLGRPSFSGQSFGSGHTFNPIPGGAPQPFLVEQPPVTATAISSGLDQTGGAPQQ